MVRRRAQQVTDPHVDEGLPIGGIEAGRSASKEPRQRPDRQAARQYSGLTDLQVLFEQPTYIALRMSC